MIVHRSRQTIPPTRCGFLKADQRQVYWEYYGQQDREAVALLNGLAMSTESWQSFLPLLLDEYDVLLFDYLGQGQSSRENEAYFIPSFCGYLQGILETLSISKIHLMGISYGGFVALDFARLYQERLFSLTLSGILLTHEELFRMYQDLSLRFYRAGPEGFELYTHYLYEKIFGETFVRSAKDHLEPMRQNFHERYKDHVYCLIRLTEAQDPFFGSLGENLEGYRGIKIPILVMTGAEDRVILPSIQQKIGNILPHARWQGIADAGHVVYLEKPDVFFGNLKAFLRQGAETRKTPGNDA
ncbi:MAG: alpha/beta hydrolase [Gammaproteobacteria bacterium]